jgi:drug/metabolite transporter (DMT)-like permease
MSSPQFVNPGDGAAHRPLRGALLLILALFLFACLDTTMKYLAVRYQVTLIVAVRYIVNCLLLILLVAPTHGRQLVETQRTGLVLVRGACLAFVSLLMGFALQRIPVAEATAINFLGPMIVVLLAGRLLGERIGLVGWSAAIAGFLGVLLIVRPGSGLDPLGVVFVLLAVSGNAAYQLLSRLLAGTERTVTLLFYTTLIGAIGFGLAFPWFWDGRVPEGVELLLFLSLGVTGGLGHFLFTASYRYAPASTLAPMTYLQLLWAGLLGWIVFGHVPDGLSVVGMCVVAASGLAMALKSNAPPATVPPALAEARASTPA